MLEIGQNVFINGQDYGPVESILGNVYFLPNAQYVIWFPDYKHWEQRQRGMIFSLQCGSYSWERPQINSDLWNRNVDGNEQVWNKNSSHWENRTQPVRGVVLTSNH